MLELEELVTTNGSYENISIIGCKTVNDLIYRINKDFLIQFYDKNKQYEYFVIPEYIVSFKIKEEN